MPILAIMRGMRGGDPDRIGDGGAELVRLGALVRERANGFTQGGRAALGVGDDRLAAAINRYVAASSQYAVDVGEQLKAAGQLASNAAADLRAAGGGH